MLKEKKSTIRVWEFYLNSIVIDDGGAIRIHALSEESSPHQFPVRPSLTLDQKNISHLLR